MKYQAIIAGRQPLKEQANRIYVAIEAIERSLEKEPLGAELDLTMPQLKTLVAVSRNKCCTMSELGRMTGYAASALTGIVDRMIKKKLVERVRDEKDRRIVKVMATRSGFEIADEFYDKILKCTSSVLEKMNRDEREKLTSLIEKIAGSFAGQY